MYMCYHSLSSHAYKDLIVDLVFTMVCAPTDTLPLNLTIQVTDEDDIVVHRMMI